MNGKVTLRSALLLFTLGIAACAAAPEQGEERAAARSNLTDGDEAESSESGEVAADSQTETETEKASPIAGSGNCPGGIPCGGFCCPASDPGAEPEGETEPANEPGLGSENEHEPSPDPFDPFDPFDGMW